jgi:hypothetical protein
MAKAGRVCRRKNNARVILPNGMKRLVSRWSSFLLKEDIDLIEESINSFSKENKGKP